MVITHLLFVDDILIFYNGRPRDAEKLTEILNMFRDATGMLINLHKSTLSITCMEEDEITIYKSFFPYPTLDFN
jgi:hypothetical protein